MTHRRHIPILCAAAVLSAWACAAPGATVYKWVDGQGGVHYSDQRGAADAEAVPLPAAPRPDADAAVRRAKERKLLRVFEEERREQRTAEAKASKAREERGQKCAQARRQQLNYEHARYLYDEDRHGNRRILSDAEHREVLQRTATAVRRLCGSP